MPSPDTLFYALIGGVLPAVLWLWFWLKEDGKHPEPRSLIIKMFIAGMVAVVLVFPIEKWAYNIIESSFAIIFAWAIIEEVMKFAAAYTAGLSTRFFDEPIDAVIYFITVALGFAALENTLFIIKPLLDGEALLGALTGNLRFVGATLLHVAASGSIGAALAFSFYKSRAIQIISMVVGLGAAIILHTVFNFFIIHYEGTNTFYILGALWFVVILLILMLERIKRLQAK
ncbi:MAG: hypothetical protein COW88_02515 [Candidatus Lloydbacteria bacterium CG22_combo_CG10-13_8_21_14_all_47_15]|uniref:Protease PrsW n=1 Tax=Candidatus Lloydbacteria bacterium CG22_combo_CG10-13_8_21_14_all_47_15 TaxID=1974635 RepID=A0A2H0CTJ4_9BACT|nr:MAG: hypothetical protein COW88_02515 [Candidatus Lloydbacteria bacterium CG22_combo_CG10-13_8_21_14_all_47_15]